MNNPIMPRLVGFVGVVSLIAIMKWIFGDEFGVAMFVILAPFVVGGVVVLIWNLVEMIFSGKWWWNED